MSDLNFSFSHPYFLLLLELIPVMMLYYFRYYRKQRSVIQLSTLAGFKNYQKTFRQKLIHIPFILRTLGIFCLIIAMADPKTVRYRQVRDSSPGETVLLMDISQNSLARDFNPNRFESLKISLDHFLDTHIGGSFGLITMGRQVLTQIPITEDIQTLKNTLEELQPETTGSIHLEEGLELGKKNFAGSQALHKQILVFLSSSPRIMNDHYHNPLFKKLDSISVYPMLLASDGIASYPIIKKRDTLYSEKIIDISESPFRDLARNTGGLFFRSRNNVELEKNFLKLDDALEKLKTRRDPNYQGILPFAWMAAILLILEITARYTLFKSLP